MKKIISLFLSICMSFSYLTLTVKAYIGEPFLWLEAEDSISYLSGGFAVSNDSSASNGKKVLLNTTADGDHSVSFAFNIYDENTYDIYLLGTPGSVPWASYSFYSLDGGSFVSDKGEGDSVLYQDNSFGGNVSWHKVTTTKFNSGSHSITYKCPDMSTINNRYYFYIDVIAVVPSSWNYTPVTINSKPLDNSKIFLSYKEGSVSANAVRAEDTVKVKVSNTVEKNSIGETTVWAGIYYGDDVVTEQIDYIEKPLYSMGKGESFENEFELKLPFNVPDGEYEVRTGVNGVRYIDGKEYIVVDKIWVGDKYPKPYEASINDLDIPEKIKKGDDIAISFSVKSQNPLKEQTTAYVELWKDGLLYDVIESKDNTVLDANTKISFNGQVNSDLPPGEYTAKAGVHKLHSESEEKLVTVLGENNNKYYKPMSYGYCKADKTGKEAFWYVTQNSVMMWNGEPYIPMGGMFVSEYCMLFNQNDEEHNKKNLQTDMEDLKVLYDAGVRDLYLLPQGGIYGRTWVVQYLLDIFEEMGFNYGLEPVVAGSGECRAMNMFYPRATEGNRIKAANVTSSGTVNATSSSGIASAGYINAVNSVYVVIDENGDAVDSGIGQLKEEGNNFVYSADVKLQNEGEAHTVYFTPQVYGSTYVTANYWGEESYFEKRLASIGNGMKVGDGFRFFVDPMQNEMGIYNAGEIQRYNSVAFNGEFAQWLKDKYKSVETLNTAWKSDKPVLSFEQAARLIPVYTESAETEESYKCFYVDQETGAGFALDCRSGESWNDYLVFRDYSFMKKNNLMADTLKKYVDAPVIFKQCSIQRDYFINKDLYSGFDGLGSECYGSVERARLVAGTTVSHVRQFARTAWVITTETNTEENILEKYESGQWGYPSEKHMNEHFDGQFRNGVKGIFDFLLSDRSDEGGILQKTYSYIYNIHTLPWLSKYIEKVNSDEFKKEITQNKCGFEPFYYYPACRNWWWKPMERTIVQNGDDTEYIKRFVLSNGDPIYQTENINIDTKLIFVNLENGPFSNIYGRELSKLLNSSDTDKRICILGHRNDLGTIPEIDRYYTNEKAEINSETKETVQILKPDSNCEVLKTTEDGKVWAMRKDNIFIISSDKFFYEDGEVQTIKYAEELGVTTFN